MTYVVQHFFDSVAEERIRDIQRAIGTGDILGRPHVSLASCVDLDIDRILPRLDEIARTTPPFTLAFTGVGTFLTEEGIVYLAPAPTATLLSIQRRVMHIVRLHGAGINPYYTGDIWTPHCTIANRLNIDARTVALRACCREAIEFTAAVRSIGLVEYGNGAGQDLCEYALSLGSGGILGIDHVQITIPKGSEDAARAFYCGVLGLGEIDKPGSLAGRGGFWLQVGDRQIHVGTEPDFDRTVTKAHLAYAVDTLDDWRTILEGQGIEILDGVPIPGYTRFEFRDPFGNRVEMIQAITNATGN